MIEWRIIIWLNSLTPNEYMFSYITMREKVTFDQMMMMMMIVQSKWKTVMVFNATFNNISAWLSVLFVEQTGELGVRIRPAANHLQTLSYNVVSPTPRQERVTNGWLSSISCLLCIRPTHIVSYHDSQLTSLWSYSLKISAHRKTIKFQRTHGLPLYIWVR